MAWRNPEQRAEAGFLASDSVIPITVRAGMIRISPWAGRVRFTGPIFEVDFTLRDTSEASELDFAFRCDLST